nr:hypothetical protein [Tanacetum cinerariifolium]
MGQLSQSKRKDIGHELEVARVTKRMKTMDYDDNKQVIRYPYILVHHLAKSYACLNSRNFYLNWKRSYSMRRKKKEKFKAENERLSIERDKTLADLGTWQNQISRHEGEVEFASLFKEVICTEKLLADIQSKNLSTKDMQAELESNKFGTSQ